MDTESRKAYTKALEARYFGVYEICDEAQLLSVDAEQAFWYGAFIASILTAQSAIESYLRYYYGSSSAKSTFYDLVEDGRTKGYLTADQSDRLHWLRKLRNRWVHANDPADDGELFEHLEDLRSEQEAQAKKAMELMFEMLFIDPGL